MSVTVIATGFPTHDGSPSAPAASKETAVKNAAPASAYANQKEQPAPAHETTPLVDDSDFVDIMSIFNKK